LRNYYVAVWQGALNAIFGWTPERIDRWIEQYRKQLRPDDEVSMLYLKEPIWYVTRLLMPPQLAPPEERRLFQSLFDAIRPRGTFDATSITNYDWSAAKAQAVQILAEYGVKIPDWDWEENRTAVCAHCGCPISPDRLQLVPSATRCFDCQTKIERGRG